MKINRPSGRFGVTDARCVAILLLGGYALFSPALPQVAGIGAPYVRQWTMFSGSGVGVAKGVFSLRAKGQTVRELSPLEAAGLARYPAHVPIYRFDRLISDEADIVRLAEPTCASLEPDQSLWFEGRVGRGLGWAEPQALLVCGKDRS